ncbi:MAG TPA: serine/threonine-protein kinase [Polyangiaceae bacterium]
MNAGATELIPGDRLLDRYTVVDRIGNGGMASIYRAMDDRLDRIVCVKLLHLELEGSGSTSGRKVYEATYAHFQKEALALSKLRHPNTLRIYDFGYLPNSKRPFQVSEFLEGGNLEEQVKFRGRLSHAEVLAILERICGAVDEAHSQGIIHRDIKPSNILFGKVGDQMLPKLADFGIAHSDLKKQGGEQDEVTVSSIALFSPRWAAPEQLAGGKQDARTDVYALGLTAYFMLAGRVLFEGSDVRSTFTGRVRGDDLVGRLVHDTRFSPALESVLMTAMASNAEARYPTPKAFFEAIRVPLSEAPSSPRPATSIPPSEKPRSSHEPPPANDSGPQSLRGFVSRTRRVDVQEKIDLSFAGPNGDQVRFRVSLVPSADRRWRLNIKGLNCFVRQSGRPTPAIVADRDGVAELISTAWEPLGQIGWSFGEPRMSAHGPGRAFRLSDGEMMVPSDQAQNPIAIFLGAEGDVVMMCADR